MIAGDFDQYTLYIIGTGYYPTTTRDLLLFTPIVVVYYKGQKMFQTGRK